MGACFLGCLGQIDDREGGLHVFRWLPERVQQGATAGQAPFSKKAALSAFAPLMRYVEFMQMAPDTASITSIH